jgi:hydrogenase nickel incorporation protein HypA/HybF
MHELSIALSIVDIALEQAQSLGTVEAVHLKLGPLAGVVPRALISAWELAREGTAVAGAELVIQEVPLVVWCPACEANQPAESLQHLCCSVCGTPTAEVITGRELEVTALEVSDDPANAIGGSSAESAEAK